MSRPPKCNDTVIMGGVPIRFSTEDGRAVHYLIQINCHAHEGGGSIAAFTQAVAFPEGGPTADQPPVPKFMQASLNMDRMKARSATPVTLTGGLRRQLPDDASEGIIAAMQLGTVEGLGPFSPFALRVVAICIDEAVNQLGQQIATDLNLGEMRRGDPRRN